MPTRFWLAICIAVLSQGASAGAVLESLEPFLVNHYTFDNPLGGDPFAPVEFDLGSDATNIHLVNGAPRIVDGAWWGSQFALQTGQRNTGPNDDWKAGIMFSSSATSTLSGTNHVTGVTVMGWFKPLRTINDNPSPNTNTADPTDMFNAFGLAGLLRGDDNTDGLDGHAVRVLIEVIDGKVTGLGRRRDSTSDSGRRASIDDWHVVMPPGVWTHLAAAFDFDHGTIDLYKNGEPLAASEAETDSWNINSNVNFTSSSNAGGIKIGGSYPDNSQERNPFNGRLDELMFFNKTLSAAEVAAQFALISNVPGDFNHDGSVDAADYAVWRKGLGTIYSPEDYGVWAANFGTLTGGSGVTGGSSAVPEPTGGVIALIGSAIGSTLLIRRHR